MTEHDANAACAQCHRAIYEKYCATPMANASGKAAAGFLAADFTHQHSSVHYKIDEESGKVWLDFERAEASRPLSGRRELRFFIGSGKRGRTYLFEEQGYWFESPVNWYAKQRVWDMAPSYQSTEEMPLTMPVDSGCLHCHASGVATAAQGARNHFTGEPFLQGGIACTECHGDARAHLASGGKSPMLKISALEPVRRDSICLNCHLEGQVSVGREGKKGEEFAPGDNLFDFTVFFVYKGASGSGGRATSEWEALLKSACKRKSGDRLTCTSCHDPHGSPKPEERVAFYRTRCLQCHGGAGFEERHHPENPDCVQCHMAKPPSNDIAHEQITDHWIRRRVNQQRLPAATTGDLQTVGGTPASSRDFGLAYAQMAERGDAGAATRAMDLLRKGEEEESGAGQDAALHAQLGFLEQSSGQTRDAIEEYRRALNADRHDEVAEANLAVMDAKRGQIQEAMRLWSDVFENDPAAQAAGMNLAVTQCALGEDSAALETVERILDFSPDSDRARMFEEKLRSSPKFCDEMKQQARHASAR